MWLIYGNMLTYSQADDIQTCKQVENFIWHFVRISVYLGYPLFLMYLGMWIDRIIRVCLNSNARKHGYHPHTSCFFKLEHYRKEAIYAAMEGDEYHVK
jgi:hypothetical protein